MISAGRPPKAAGCLKAYALQHLYIRICFSDASDIDGQLMPCAIIKKNSVSNDGKFRALKPMRRRSRNLRLIDAVLIAAALRIALLRTKRLQVKADGCTWVNAVANADKWVLVDIPPKLRRFQVPACRIDPGRHCPRLLFRSEDR